MLLTQTQEDGVKLQVASADSASDANLKKQSHPEEENVAQDVQIASPLAEPQVDGTQDMKDAADSKVR